MIFKITKEGDFFEDNPTAKLIEEFTAISSDEMKYLCLVHDYESPFRNMTPDVRKFKVLDKLGFKKDFKGNKYPPKVLDLVYGANPLFASAIEELRSMMFNEDLEDIQAYKSQKEEIRTFLKQKDKTPGEMKNVKSYVEAQSILDDKIREIEERLRENDEKEYIANEKDELGTTSASLVEIINELD